MGAVESATVTAPPRSSGPLEPQEAAGLPAPPLVQMGGLTQLLRFNQRQIEFVFGARRRLGDVFAMRTPEPLPLVITSLPEDVRSLFTAKPEEAPSNLGVVGRYILQPEVMRVLDNPVRGAGGEIQLTDAMAQLIGTQPFHGLTVEAERHDCGDKIGFVKANLALALKRDDVAPAIRAFLSQIG